MWKTSCNLFSVDNGWVVDFVFQYIPRETDPEIMVELARKNAKVIHMIFSKREEAVIWLNAAIDCHSPVSEAAVDQVGNA